MSRLVSGRLIRAALPIILIAALWLPLLLVRVNLLPNLLFVGSYEADLLAVLSIIGMAGTMVVAASGCAVLWMRARLRRAQQVERIFQGASHRDFLRRLDHEMKNPITTMRIGLLNLQSALPTEQHDSLARIVQQTQRLQRLVEDLRYLTEIEEQHIESIPVNLRDVLENAVELVRSSQATKVSLPTIELHVQQVPWPLPDVSGDPELLLIVFRNLLDNALKYTQPEGKVVVRSTEAGGMALVEVADTGIGIAVDDLDHVFEDLYRGSNARGIPGNGLGLALVQRIIGLHRGKIEVNSRLEQGTVLKVWLPLVK